MVKYILLAILVIFIVVVLLILSKIQYINRMIDKSSQEILQCVTAKEKNYVSYAVIDYGNITYHTYHKGVEISNHNFDYEIGSISKTFTALLVSRAMEEGKLNLNDPISKYLDLPKGTYYPTIKRLITHTSGYKSHYLEPVMLLNHLLGRNDFYSVSREMLMKKVAEIHVSDQDYPFLYSNFGLSVVGLVLESVYQKDYTDLLNDYLHNELHMKHTSVATSSGNLSGYWKWDKNDGYIPAGAIISNLTDMAQYLSLMMNYQDDYIHRPLQHIRRINANSSFN